MNLHVPQSEETRAELKEIAAVPRQIVSPQANKPVMGIVQDTLCGIRKFTLRDCFMEADFVQNILLWVANWDGQIPPPAIIKPRPLWTGKQILSMCIPKGINIRHSLEDGEPESNPGDKAMWIEDGEIIYGVVNKKIVGASAGGLIDVTFREKGFEVCRDLFSALQKVSDTRSIELVKRYEKTSSLTDCLGSSRLSTTGCFTTASPSALATRLLIRPLWKTSPDSFRPLRVKCKALSSWHRKIDWKLCPV